MKLHTALLDLFFPPKCPYCQHILDVPRAPVCPDCQPKLPWLVGDRGERDVEHLQSCFSPLAYHKAVPDAIHRYKFQRIRAYSQPFGTLMAQCLQDHLPQGADLITWCPLSRRRLRERGFDQAELLARAVGKQLGIPVQSTLKKIRNTTAQSGLEGDSARQANAMGAYQPIKDMDLTGKRVVLVDDVVTSGATMSECASQLLNVGASVVYGLTIAQARPGSRGKEENKGEKCNKK